MKFQLKFSTFNSTVIWIYNVQFEENWYWNFAVWIEIKFGEFLDKLDFLYFLLCSCPNYNIDKIQFITISFKFNLLIIINVAHTASFCLGIKI